MRVSIVTISFNQAQFLEECLLSVLHQNYPDIEYIVVDPGSTDGSRQIIERYRDSIDHVIFEPDDGPADGLNKGFAYATGDIFGFLNSDDYLLPSSLTKVVSYFHEHPNIDVLSGCSQIVDSEGKHLRKFYSDRFSLLRSAYGCSILAQPSTFFKKNAFSESGGFNKSNRTNWDDELWIDMALKGAKFQVVDECFSAYRVHKASITGSANQDFAIRQYAEYRFYKILHRHPKFYDKYWRFIFRLIRYFMQPRHVYERIVYGPVYGRFR